MADRRSPLQQWVEALTALGSLVIMLDVHTGGAVRRWIERTFAPPPHVQAEHRIYGMAREASHYTREAAERREHGSHGP